MNLGNDVKERLDVSFYHSPLGDEFLNKCKKNKIALKAFGFYIKLMKRYPSFYGIPYLLEGTPCLKGECITEDGFIDDNKLSFIPKTLHNMFPETHLDIGDLVFSVRGAVGKVTIVSKKYKGGNISANLIRIKLKKGINPEFIKYFLLSTYGQAQISQISSGSLQDTITTDDIKSIKIPDTKEKQQKRIVGKIKDLEKDLSGHRKKYRQKVDEIKNIFERKIKFSFSFNKIKSFLIEINEDRLDCYSNFIEFRKNIEKLKKVNKQNFDILKGKDLNIILPIRKEEIKESISTQFKYIAIADIGKNLGKIKSHTEDVLISLPKRARQRIRENDILIPRPIGSTEGIVTVPKEYNGQICSTGFIVIRPKDYEEALFLWAILKSNLLQKQFFYLQSGSLQPEITPENFKERILIPIPKKKKVKEDIIKEIKSKTKEAEDNLKEYQELKQRIKEVFLEEIGLK